jgi:hypothetical protein
VPNGIESPDSRSLVTFGLIVFVVILLFSLEGATSWLGQM